MKVHFDSGDFNSISTPVVTVGTFDGVHRGHLSVIARLKEIARKINGETVVVTFNLHPRQVLQKDVTYKVLSTLKEKEALLRDAGVDHLVVLPFTEELASLSFSDFVGRILVGQLHAKAMVIGYDHHFGNNRQGNFEKLKPLAAEYGVELFRVEQEEVEHIAVSSTKIRNALQSGQLKEANSLLGYRYSIEGKVTKGNMIGRQLGYHTANVLPDDNSKLIPARGVYAASVIHDDMEYRGMLNIGIRPTIDDKKETIEVHILGFNRDIYDHTLKVIFWEYIREEKKFQNFEELKAAIDADKLEIIKIFEERPL